MIGALRAAKAGRQRRQHDQREPGAAGGDAAAAVRGDAVLHQRQQLVDGERQRRRRGAAEQHEHPVLRLQAGEDVVAEAGLPDRRRQRRRADHPHRRGAHAGHDHRRGDRQFDVSAAIATGVMASARAASRTPSPTPLRPVTVLRSTGSIE